MSFKWYDRVRDYSYGDYDSSRRLYYNEDSGKWVSWLDKSKIIEEKYIRYEFSVWDEREIEAEFGYDLVERIGRFLFVLYKKGLEVERRRGDRWVYVDKSKICCGILGGGGKYIEIIERLIDLGVIDRKYGIGKFGNDRELYELNEKFFSKDCYRRVLKIRNSKLNKFLDKLYSGDLVVGDRRDEFIRWEIESCKRLNLYWDEDGLLKLLWRRLNKRKELDYERKDWDFLSNKKRDKIKEGWDERKEDDYIWKGRLSFELLRVELEELKSGGFSFNGFSKDSFSGRYSNVVNNKEREFRGMMKMDGERLVEIDMVNGYVSLFYRVLKGINELNKGDNKFDDYIKKVVGDVDVSDFLEKYKVCFEGDIDKRIDFYDFVGYDLGMVDAIIGKRGSERVYMKELVLYLLNGERSDGERKRYFESRFSYLEIMEKIFCKGGVEVIEKIKNSDLNFKLVGGKDIRGYLRYKNMSRVLMGMEVIIMKGIWKRLIEKEINYVSLYDGMMVKKSDVGVVLDIVGNELSDFSSCIRLKVK